MRVRYWVTSSRDVVRLLCSAAWISGMVASSTVKGCRRVCPLAAAVKSIRSPISWFDRVIIRGDTSTAEESLRTGRLQRDAQVVRGLRPRGDPQVQAAGHHLFAIGVGVLFGSCDALEGVVREHRDGRAVLTLLPAVH